MSPMPASSPTPSSSTSTIKSRTGNLPKFRLALDSSSKNYIFNDRDETTIKESSNAAFSNADKSRTITTTSARNDSDGGAAIRQGDNNLQNSTSYFKLGQDRAYMVSKFCIIYARIIARTLINLF